MQSLSDDASACNAVACRSIPTIHHGPMQGGSIIPLAVSLFGVVMALNPLLFMVLYAYIRRNLIKPVLIATEDPYIIRKSFVGVFS